MAYAAGIALAFIVVCFGRATGLDRDRAFYPILVIVIASYYVLFAVMAGPRQTLVVESIVTSAFVLVAVAGFRVNLWLVVACLGAHGVFDVLHASIPANPGVPDWWPAFCLTFDVGTAGFLTWLLMRSNLAVARPRRALDRATGDSTWQRCPERSMSPALKLAYERELALATQAEASGQLRVAFEHLERAHILGQRSTHAHVRTHWRMLRLGVRMRDRREMIGQVTRLIAALAVTRIWVPTGNTGGANVSATKPMPVPEDLRRLLEAP